MWGHTVPGTVAHEILHHVVHLCLGGFRQGARATHQFLLLVHDVLLGLCQGLLVGGIPGLGQCGHVQEGLPHHREALGIGAREHLEDVIQVQLLTVYDQGTRAEPLVIQITAGKAVVGDVHEFGERLVGVRGGIPQAGREGVHLLPDVAKHVPLLPPLNNHITEAQQTGKGRRIHGVGWCGDRTPRDRT